jgi:hypothetical protein
LAGGFWSAEKLYAGALGTPKDSLKYAAAGSSVSEADQNGNAM